MNTELLVSIISPVYNTEKYLEKCINSIISQTYVNWELILINDGSTDESLNICKKFANEYLNIFIFSQENKGVSSARNLGIEKSKGKYLCFVDSDDYVEPDYLNIFMNNISENIMIVQDFNRIYNKKDNLTCVNNFNGEDFYLPNDLGNLIKEQKYIQGYLFNKIFERKLIHDNSIEFNEKITMCEDEIFYFKYLQVIKKIVFINSNTYNYVASENSLTSRHAKYDSEFLYCLECNKFYHYLLSIENSLENQLFFKTKFSRNFNHLLRTVIYWGNYDRKNRIKFLKEMRIEFSNSLNYLKADTFLKKIDYFLFKVKLFKILDTLLYYKMRNN